MKYKVMRSQLREELMTFLKKERLELGTDYTLTPKGNARILSVTAVDKIKNHQKAKKFKCYKVVGLPETKRQPRKVSIETLFDLLKIREDVDYCSFLVLFEELTPEEQYAYEKWSDFDYIVEGLPTKHLAQVILG